MIEFVLNAALADPKPAKRKKATPGEWAFLRAEKLGYCRVCEGDLFIELHHLVGRDLGGDDTPDNLVPLCSECHRGVEERKTGPCLTLGLSLTHAEFGYVLNRKGPDYLARYYRVGVQVAGYPILEGAAA